MIGIVDYGMGNLGSVSNACKFLGLPAQIITRPDELGSCSAMVLPGVGAFGDCMQHLESHGFVPVVRNWIEQDQPFLGICLGLQALFAGSEESPGVPGLGVLKGTVRLFRNDGALKVPQIGWNSVSQKQAACPLFKDVADQAYVYFVHSYYADAEEESVVAGVTEYGMPYTSAVWRGNMMAVQFHPEKSQQVGLRMLRNFAETVAREVVVT